MAVYSCFGSGFNGLRTCDVEEAVGVSMRHRPPPSPWNVNRSSSVGLRLVVLISVLCVVNGSIRTSTSCLVKLCAFSFSCAWLGALEFESSPVKLEVRFETEKPALGGKSFGFGAS